MRIGWKSAPAIMLALGALGAVVPPAQADTPVCVSVNGGGAGVGAPCDSYVCTSRLFNGGNDGGCDVDVDPDGPLTIQILSLPFMMVPWTLKVIGQDLGLHNTLQCPGWSGPPTMGSLGGPLLLNPCVLQGTGPWRLNVHFGQLPRLDPNNPDPQALSVGELSILLSGPSIATA